MAPGTEKESAASRTGAGSKEDRVIDAFTNRQRLRVYWLVLTNGEPLGVRDVQRGLALSSPSVAFHHLDKLVEAGLLEKDAYGRYAVVKNVEVSVLQAFTRIGRFILPRFSFYAAFFTSLSLGYLLLSWPAPSLFVLILGGVSAGSYWYEALRVWRRRPF